MIVASPLRDAAEASTGSAPGGAARRRRRYEWIWPVQSEPGVAGSYELIERRRDGSLLLRPESERLSDVVRETEGQVFRDEEFAAHLERVAASADDLPADPPA